MLTVAGDDEQDLGAEAFEMGKVPPRHRLVIRVRGGDQDLSESERLDGVGALEAGGARPRQRCVAAGVRRGSVDRVRRRRQRRRGRARATTHENCTGETT